MTRTACTTVAALALTLSTGCASSRAGMRDVDHPFLLWTRKEAAAIRKRIETDETAKKQYESMVKRESKGACPSLLNLFKYSVMGDQQAGEIEKAELRKWFGSRPPESVPGNPNTGNRPYRDDHWLDGVRYDVLYHDLTKEDHKQFRDTVENYMEWFRTKWGPWRRCTEQGIPRTGWLPNMQYPTVAGIHVLVAATKEEALIKEVHESRGGLKWWLDYYVADGGFYMEEFGKYGSPVGAQLLWCEAMEKLGLPQYGYGYTAKAIDVPGHAGGGTMRRYLESLIRAAYPRILRRGGMPDYPCVAMGDAGTQAVVRGVDADGSAGTQWWAGPSMWGQMKMMHSFWWEIGHRRFPDAGFGYFLAQMRGPDEDMYLPSLFFGLGPIDPKKVKPPTVESYAAHERGFALLRAEESPAYWESPKPAVALQFGMYYVHYVHDCFSILGYVAHNRHVYQKMGSMAGGYAGGDAWRDHVRGQASGVTVDDLRVEPVDTGDQGCRNQRIRSKFSPAAKFTAIRAKPGQADPPDTKPATRRATALYPDVDAERALVLTAEYLFDVFWLKSTKDRVYDWHVQGAGRIEGARDKPWSVVDTLPGARFSEFKPRPQKKGQPAPVPLTIRRKPASDSVWAESLVDRHVDGEIVGVRVSMLPAPGTEIYTFAGPNVDPTNNAVLMVRRTASGTVFAALHEPFKGGKDAYNITGYERIAESEQGIAVTIRGSAENGVNDRILLRYGDDVDKLLTFTGSGESFTFTDYVHIRIGKKAVTVDGNLAGMKLKVEGSPDLILNGEKASVTVDNGVLTFGVAGGG